jgi:hypothetical protein
LDLTFLHPVYAMKSVFEPQSRLNGNRVYENEWFSVPFTPFRWRCPLGEVPFTAVVHALAEDVKHHTAIAVSQTR